MRHKIVLVPFPFDDLSSQNVRPAICLTNLIEPYGHVVLAFITSRISDDSNSSDIVIRSDGQGFEETGLKVSSTVRLHRLMTVSKSTIKRELGKMPETYVVEIEYCLRKLFGL